MKMLQKGCSCNAKSQYLYWGLAPCFQLTADTQVSVLALNISSWGWGKMSWVKKALSTWDSLKCQVSKRVIMKQNLLVNIAKLRCSTWSDINYKERVNSHFSSIYKTTSWFQLVPTRPKMSCIVFNCIAFIWPLTHPGDHCMISDVLLWVIYYCFICFTDCAAAFVFRMKVSKYSFNSICDSFL